ncbi:hypothetical protein SCB71_06385 [Herbiconiux sp. KACC 21604]|uniref:hypothetical protein n=1 Tax=unclassified Herbiconiux TaxID=2618217 RepID=UPI001490BC30|nr:hypothetical protein [Herbiconiux sp. SALV-R1]QJU52944.1 hypothetical protein HL652_04370 [Herbiconiux sp. SALV-R1]WPO87866.1 hypothetical protein SCB71_06385 [Herbiconiux sp. KACC 21604]
MTDLLGDQEPVMRVVQVAPRTTSSAVACAQINELQEGDMGDQERVTDLAARLDERARAFNDAGLRYGVADLLTEAAERLRAAESERDSAVKEMHDRELHHFEVEEEASELRAELAVVKQQRSDNLREITARDAVIAEAHRAFGDMPVMEGGSGASGEESWFKARVAEFMRCRDLLAAAPVSVLASHAAEVAAKARGQALRDALAQIVEGAPPLNAELTLTPAGVVEDRAMSAYVEGHHDAWAAVNSMILAEATESER